MQFEEVHAGFVTLLLALLACVRLSWAATASESQTAEHLFTVPPAATAQHH